MSSPMKTVVSIVIPAILALGLCSTGSAAESDKRISSQDFSRVVREMRRCERKKKYQESVGKMTDYLKTPGLSDQQRLLLRQYIATASAKLDDAAYEKALAEFRAIPDSQAKRKAMTSLIRGIVPLDFAAAQKLFREEAPKIAALDKLGIYRDFAKSSLWGLDDQESFDSYLAEIRKLENPDAGDKAKASRFEAKRVSTIADLIGELASYNPAAAKKLFSTHEAPFSESALVGMYGAFVRSAVKFRDREAFEAELARFQKLPHSPAKLRALFAITRSLLHGDKEIAERLLRDELKNPNLDAQMRFELLSQILGLNRVRVNFYGFSGNTYENFRSIAGEIDDLVAKGSVKNKGKLANFYFESAKAAFLYGDYQNGAEAISRAYELSPNNSRMAFLAAESAMRAGKQKRADTILGAIIANRSVKKDDRNLAKALRAVNAGQGIAGIDAAVAEQELTMAPRMELLRRVSTTLYKLGRYDEVRELDNQVKKMFVPHKDKEYLCEYIPNAPKTADGWARSRYYNDWNRMATAFVPYGNDLNVSKDIDVKRHLTDAEQPEIDPAYRTGVHLAYDDEGFHIYTRCDDPQMRDIILGKRKAGLLEYFLKPGLEFPYHSWHFKLPGTEDPYIVNWATPGKGYRMTYDFFEKDTVATPEAVVAHTYVPWMMFYDKLPVDGNQWTFDMKRFDKGVRATLGGRVHEHARAMKLKFNFTRSQLIALKRNICVMAFNRYHNMRQDEGGDILAWKDKVLGDPEFYQTELKPLLDELDEAGVRLTAPAKDSEIGGFFAEYAPLWAEIAYVVADKRREYLKQKFLLTSRRDPERRE